MGVPVGDRWGKTLSRFPKLHAVVAVAGCAALIAVVVPTNAALALEASSPVERMAVRARVVQSEMMVAALSCGLRNQYNTVVTEFRSELVSHGRVLRSMFQRQHGASGQTALDRYITKLANDASIRSNRARSAYCESAKRAFADVLSGRVELVDSGVRIVTVQEAANEITVRQ